MDRYCKDVYRRRIAARLHRLDKESVVSKEFIREGLARKLAHEYVARLLLDEGEHIDAFDDDELTAAERAEARAEVHRVGMSFIPKHNATL